MKNTFPVSKFVELNDCYFGSKIAIKLFGEDGHIPLNREAFRLYVKCFNINRDSVSYSRKQDAYWAISCFLGNQKVMPLGKDTGVSYEMCKISVKEKEAKIYKALKSFLLEKKSKV